MAIPSTFEDIKNMLVTKPEIDSLTKLFTHALKDIYWAENQILASLKEMEPKAQDASVQEMLATHYSQTQMHIQRLEKVFVQMGLQPTTETCEAMKGILDEGDHLVGQTAEDLRDQAIVFAAQAVEHYEIGRYQTMIEWARQMLQPKVVSLLELNLADETETLELLDGYIAADADSAEADDDSDDDNEDETDKAMARRTTMAAKKPSGSQKTKRALAKRATTRQATKAVKDDDAARGASRSSASRKASKADSSRKTAPKRARKAGSSTR